MFNQWSAYNVIGSFRRRRLKNILGTFLPSVYFLFLFFLCSKGRGGSSEGYSAPTSPDLYNEQNVDSAFEMSPGGLSEVDTRQGWKKPGLKKNSPVGFFGFFGVFFEFFFCFLFFSVFFIYICPEERVFRVFFSFMNTFRCIQTLYWNHSY